MGPLPVAPNAITFTNVATEFGLTINSSNPRGLGANFRFAAGTYTPASPAIPTGSTSSIALSANLGGKTYTPAVLPPLYAFDNFLFTSSNVTGATGPTLAQFTTGIPATPGGLGQPYYTLNMYTTVTTQAFYSGYWSLYLNKPGYQQWTVPETSVYSVIACGGCGGVHAQGAIGTNTTANFGGGGYAAVVAGPFNFTRSQNLIITIGQQGVSTFSNVIPASTRYQGKGGGGATTIVDAANTSVPILVAAGGGGQIASTIAPTGYIGGRGGRAISFITATGSTSAAGTDAQPGSSGAAAGFSVNGGGTTAAQSWANGSSGGTNADASAGFICPGGFGGGGPGGFQTGVQSKGGGGGGWIGGNGSAGEYGVSTSQQQSGGGGGVSYCLTSTSASAGASPIYLGYTNQLTTSVINTGMPQVFDGCCWIKKMTPRSTLLPLITFTDCFAYRYAQPGPPTLDDRSTYYTSTDLTATLCPYWFGHTNGYHAWCVPKTGVYEITAAGGGGDWALSAANRGGRGRLITARYSLSLGDVLIIQVGHRGYLPTLTAGSGGGGGCTTVHLNGMTASWNGTSGHLISTTIPGYPLLCASAGNGGAAVAIGADASATDITGAVTSAPFGGQLGTTNNTISSGGNLYVETTGRTGTWHRTSIPNGWGFVDHYLGVPFHSGGAGAGWGGGGRGSGTVNLTGGGAGWVAGGGSNNGTGGPSQSYYWSGTYYVAGSYSAGYNAIAPSNPAAGTNVGSGYVTIQGIS